MEPVMVFGDGEQAKGQPRTPKLSVEQKKKGEPGYRFAPTEEELILFFLRRKVLGKPDRGYTICEVDYYKYPPWELPNLCGSDSGNRIWHFFAKKELKYNTGCKKSRRDTIWGSWKKTGKDKPVRSSATPRVIGKKSTLIFHMMVQGKVEKDRTDWVMHEYRLDDAKLQGQNVDQESYVIIKLYKKSGIGRQPGDNYGEAFLEEEWYTDDDEAEIRNQEENDAFDMLARDYSLLP
ncbi:NAC domain-containing protein 82-like [Spinacia oleracea]|uniref:NAC domain-containing protein 82-like n=1 Tax=Spinacia oleracea TaxID=3562 RepID=A0ABM3RR46_SPIOL|nr:NAC domain-containing protein 82-like [Spinacia oleracea]